jgi:hypothetical protein
MCGDGPQYPSQTKKIAAKEALIYSIENAPTTLA